MTRLTVIGMIITGLTLTGCVGDRDIKSLEKKQAELLHDVEYLQARVAAVEQACVQINARLIDSENRKAASPASDQSSIIKPAGASTNASERDQTALITESHAKLSRSSFSRRLVGMTISEALTILGKPDKTSEDAGIQTWTYNAVRLPKEDGGLEQSPAMIVFEQGCVSRAVLTENVQYSPEPIKKEPENTAANGNITANTNSTADGH